MSLIHLVGLTGGTGSGKTEAANQFAALGFAVIDADAVGHGLIAPGGSLEAAVIEEFGTRVSTAGHVDRKKLGALVFGDPDQRARLNALIHPAIRAVVAERCAVLAKQGHSVVILDAALLAEGGVKDSYLSALILVLAAPEIRLARLMRNRGMGEAAARMQIDAQTPPENKRAAADWVIVNEGTLESLRREVERVAKAIRDRYDEAGLPT